MPACFRFRASGLTGGHEGLAKHRNGWGAAMDIEWLHSLGYSAGNDFGKKSSLRTEYYFPSENLVNDLSKVIQRGK